MTARTAAAKKRRGIVSLDAAVFFLAAMLAMWWLVARTNSEGHHDAQLLPLVALIPSGIGLYHLIGSRL